MVLGQVIDSAQNNAPRNQSAISPAVKEINYHKTSHVVPPAIKFTL